MLQLTRALSGAGADVTVAALNPSKFHVDAAAAAAAIAPATLHTADVNTSDYWSAFVRARRMHAPLIVARFHSPQFEALLRELIGAQHFDIIQLEGQFLLPYMPALRAMTGAPIVLRAQNVEFRVWEQLAERARGPRRAALRHVARALRAWEIAQINEADALLPISDDDARDFQAIGATRPSLVVPCGIDTRAIPPTPSTDRYGLYFIGSMGYRPNQEAVRWLADEVWPRVKAREPRAELTVAGSAFPRSLRAELHSRRIDVVQDVADVRTFAAPFRAMVAPLFSGSGMRIKVLEAMALGKPVIATPVGAGGIGATSGIEILIGNDAEEFANEVVRCIGDDGLAVRIGEAARAFVLGRYDEDTLATNVLEFFKSAASARPV
jgi:glycosyltransferase involved in cell wall biosynthesis